MALAQRQCDNGTERYVQKLYHCILCILHQSCLIATTWNASLRAHEPTINDHNTVSSSSSYNVRADPIPRAYQLGCYIQIISGNIVI